MTTESRSRRPARKTLTACIAIAAGATSVALADTHTVSNTSDADAGSLRQAIIDANGDLNPPVVVDATTISGTITLTTGQLVVSDRTMSIQGPGAANLTIDGGHNVRTLYIATSSKDVTISGFRFTGGQDTSSYGLGGPYGGGGLCSRNTNLTLQDSVIDSSSTPHKGGGIRIYTGAGTQSVLSNVTLSGNSASAKGGGVYINAGSGAKVTISNSMVSGNTALSSGGGIYAEGTGSIYVQGTQVVGNHATSGSGEGGGIYGNFPSGITKFSVTDSTISGNTAHLSGGGISLPNLAGNIVINHTLIGANQNQMFTGGGLRIAATGSGATTTILNSTFAGNIATGVGGAIALEGPVSTSLSNVTIVANSAAGAGGGVFSGISAAHTTSFESSTVTNNTGNDGGGIAVSDTAPSATLHNTVVANNASTTPINPNPDTSGSFTANFSFIQNPAFATITGNDNISGTDPLLGSLGNYGGATPTKAPQVGSPLLDMGDPANDADSGDDQRGLARVVGAHIDIGAVERQASEDVIFLDHFEGY